MDPRRDLAQEGQPLQWQDHQGREGPPTHSRLLPPYIHLPPSVRPWPYLGLTPSVRPLPSHGLTPLPWHNSRLDPTLSFLYIFMGWLIAIPLSLIYSFFLSKSVNLFISLLPNLMVSDDLRQMFFTTSCMAQIAKCGGIYF